MNWNGEELRDILVNNSATLNTNYQGLFEIDGLLHYSNSGR